MATSLQWNPVVAPLPATARAKGSTKGPRLARQFGGGLRVQAFRRSDFDGFAKRMASGEAWRNVWRTANDGFERFLFEAKKTAERLDRRYSVSTRLDSVARATVSRAREIDRELEIAYRWRTFSMDFSRNWPKYRKQLTDFMDTPLGRSFATIIFLWFAVSGWLFRFLIFATWVLPFAGPLLIGKLANNLVVKGDCPACKRQFVGNKNQMVRCANCGNIVWQPKGDFHTRDNRGRTTSKSDPKIIDVEIEEK